MVDEKFAASVRARRGARWLDENFPGWEDRIDIDTLELSNGTDCICGQVFEEPASEEGSTGYDYAVYNLFSEANSWITSLIKKQPIKARARGAEKRANQVSIALGFNAGSQNNAKNVSDSMWLHSDELQDAWVELLAKRGKRKIDD